MTHSESTDDTRRDAERTGGQLPHSDLTSRPASPAGSDAARHGKEPVSGSARSKGDAASTHGGQESRDRSSDAKASSHGAPTESRPTDGSRDDASRFSSVRQEGTNEAVRSLIGCVEQLVREIPRGAAARFEGVSEEIRKARKALEGATTGSHAAMTGARVEGSKAGSSSPESGDAGPSDDSSRRDRSDVIRPSATPPSRNGI